MSGVRRNPHPFSDAEAADLSMVAILQVRKNLQERKICHPEGKFRELLGIVHVTAYRRSVERYRQIVGQKTDLTGDPIEPIPPQPYAPIPVSHTLISQEDILAALSELPPPKPDIYLAVIRDGKDRHEVAETFGTTYENVNQIISRVTKWLRKRFGLEGGASA